MSLLGSRGVVEICLAQAPLRPSRTTCPSDRVEATAASQNEEESYRQVALNGMQGSAPYQCLAPSPSGSAMGLQLHLNQGVRLHAETMSNHAHTELSCTQF